MATHQLVQNSDKTQADAVASRLRSFAADLLQLQPSEVRADRLLLELGADSVALAELMRLAESEYGVKISFRQIFEELTTIEAVASYIHRNSSPASDAGPSQPARPVGQSPSLKTISFSLYFFGDYQAQYSDDKYHLLMEAAQFADRNGFAAIWVPERHFHSFGGFSPNPSVIAAALARETERIGIRAGSVVMPLHNPIRVAEEWAVVDNLSKGRAGISFASGWHPDDFVFAPEGYANRRELTFEGIETVRRLWRGQPIEVRNGAGSSAAVRIFPKPMQPELPVWLTALSSAETYVKAGELGAGVLTNLIGQTIGELTDKIALYRETLSQRGHDPQTGQITVLLHTFVGDDVELIRQQARQPFCQYLNSSVGLFQKMITYKGHQIDLGRLSDGEKQEALALAYERYMQSRALIGTPDTCSAIVDSLLRAGVNEIACLIDFGVDNELVLRNLPHLDLLRERYKG